MKVHVTSDRVEPVDVVVRWRLETLDGQILQKGEQFVRALALADTLVGSHDFAALVNAENQKKVVFVAEMWQEGQLSARSVTPFVANKHLELREPGLNVKTRIEGQVLFVDVSTTSLARFVELSLDGADPVFSDNYFDLPAGAAMTVTCALPAGWSETSKIEARSLYNSFA